MQLVHLEKSFWQNKINFMMPIFPQFLEIIFGQSWQHWIAAEGATSSRYVVVSTCWRENELLEQKIKIVAHSKKLLINTHTFSNDPPFIIKFFPMNKEVWRKYLFVEAFVKKTRIGQMCLTIIIHPPFLRQVCS